eukprot:s857_g9.t1
MNGNDFAGEASPFSIRDLLGSRSMLQSGRLVCTVFAPLAVQVEMRSNRYISAAGGAFQRTSVQRDVLYTVSDTQAGAGIIRMSCAGVMGKQAQPRSQFTQLRWTFHHS